jgi:hypothetical protein
MNSWFAQRSGPCHQPARHATAMVNPSNVTSGPSIKAVKMCSRNSCPSGVPSAEDRGARAARIQRQSGSPDGVRPPASTRATLRRSSRCSQRTSGVKGGGGDEAQLADEAAQRAPVDVRSGCGEDGDAAEKRHAICPDPRV